MNFNFGEVLTRAWQITWKHKVLWIFGILAGCGRNGSRFNSNNGRGDGGSGQLPPEMMRVWEFIQENLTAIIVGGCILLLIIWAITIFLSTIGRVGLIRGTFHADTGVEKLVFGQLFSESTPYFWRIFGLSLLAAIPVLAVVAALVAGIFALAVSAESAGNASNLGILGMFPLIIGCFCLVFPIVFVIGLIVRQAENAIVLEDLRVLPSLSRGWEVFRRNLGTFLLMGIMLAVIGLVVGLLIAAPVLLIVLPAVFSFAANDGQDWTPLIMMGVGLCIYLPILWLLNGIMTTFIESVWTLTYLRLTGNSGLQPLPLETTS